MCVCAAYINITIRLFIKHRLADIYRDPGMHSCRTGQRTVGTLKLLNICEQNIIVITSNTTHETSMLL